MFFLKHYDTTLLSFEISDNRLEDQSCRILSVNEAALHLLPIGMKPENDSLLAWLRGRVIPANRDFVDRFLAKNGLSRRDIRGILRVSRGLSLNDSYWVTEDDFCGSFKDFNLYEHDFVKVLSLIAYTGFGTSRAKGFSSSPEFTTGGMLRKGWRRLNGKILLYKGGTSGAANAGNEPYSEYYASQIAERMELEHISYGLSSWKKCICSTCELFCDIDHAYVPIHRFVEHCTLKSVSEYLKALGRSYYDAFADMLIFDALICNEDRHFGNFGLMVDSRSNQPYAFAPIFDNGLSLFDYGMSEDFKDLDSYAKTRFSSYGFPFEEIAGEFITARQKEKLRKMIGFRFTRHSSYNLPAERLKAIEGFLQRRVNMLLELPTGK